MSKNNTENEKGQVPQGPKGHLKGLLEAFEFVKTLSEVRLVQDFLFVKYLDLARQGVVFVPLRFEFQPQGKVAKKPIVPWRGLGGEGTEASENWIKRLREHYKLGSEITFGLAIRLEDFDLIVIDIDDVEKFNQNYPLSSFLEDIKESSFAIVKSISRGYHVYLPRSFLDVNRINNRKLLEKYGFEIKSEGLLVIPPSAFVSSAFVSSTQIIWVNEGEAKEGKALAFILKAIEESKQEGRGEDKQEEGKQVEEERKEGEGREEGKQGNIVEEIKKRVKFKDLISEFFVKDMGHYQLFNCPFHLPDKEPSFAVYRNSDGELAVDFHDGERYDIIEFYKKYKSIDFKQALAELAELAGISFSTLREKEKEGDLNLIGGKFFIEKGYVYEQKKKEMVCIGPAIRIKARLLDGSIITYECEYDSRTFLLKEIQDFETIRLATGKPIVNERAFKEYLLYATELYETEKRVYRSLGFFDGEYVHPYVSEGIWTEFAFYREFEKGKKFYNPEEHLKLIKRGLEDGQALGFVYCFALASLLAESLGCSPATLFVEGPARTGKTSLGLLAANLFYPAAEINFSADFTKVGLELVLKALKNCVILLDELAVSSVDTEQIVFSLSSGKGRVRGTKYLTIRYENLSSYVIFTSEVSDTSLFKRPGAFRRFLRLFIFSSQDVCSFCDIQELRSKVTLWGGGVELAKFIQERPWEGQEVEDIKDIIKARGYFPLFNIALPILFSLKVYEQFFNEKFDKMREFIFKLLDEHVEQFNKKQDVVSEFKEKFSEFIVSNVNKFIVREKIILNDEEDIKERYVEIEPRFSEIWGKIDKDKQIVYVFPKIFKKFLYENGFSFEIIKILAAEGLIEQKERDRYTVKITVQNVRVNAYAIPLNSLFVDAEEVLSHLTSQLTQSQSDLLELPLKETINF